MSKNFELLQQLSKEENLFRTSGNSSVAVRTADYERPATPDIKDRGPQPKKQAVQIRWPDRIKEKVRSWKQELPRRDTARAPELEKITRREEVKLVQRIFPGGGQLVPQVVMFSGVESGHAASMICACSSKILASRGEGPVCIIDANLESPVLHRYFHLENSKGLSDAILDSGPVQDFTHRISETNLWVMPGGSTSVGLGAPGTSDRVSSRMMELRTLFKYVLVNSSLHRDRASAALSFAEDGLVLVVEANSTRRETVREVMEELQMLGTRVLGVVLNNRTFPIPEAIYHNL
jgi:Mrp family chromosome partitioning ATPase